MKRFYLYITILATVLMLTGCGTTGIIYTHVTTPLDTNMSLTPSGVSEDEGSIRHLVLGPLHFMWDSNAIGDIAKEHGIETVYYADLEVLSILGIWNEYTIHIYGK